MATDGEDGGDADDASGGTTEPITLTDPDGSVTRVAPWSSWTREQIRAPGGEPSLVTRLDEGQLWFAAGRRRSPWRHEVVAGPATVTTPRGRFQVTAEPDGGATVVCLAGRARVATGLRQPVLLGPNQTASVSSDGSTLIVSDSPASADDDETTIEVDQSGARPAMTHDQDDDTEYFHEEDEPVVPLPAVAGGSTALDGPVEVEIPEEVDEPTWPWLPEIVAVAAILAVLFAAFVVFARPSEVEDVAAPVASTTSTTALGTTTSTSLATTTTAAPQTTTTATPPALAAPATATGSLQTCSRANGGVAATVAVTHQSGGPAPFKVQVGLVDPSGQVFAQGEEQSGRIDPGATVPVEVLVTFDGTPRGVCELIAVAPA